MRCFIAIELDDIARKYLCQLQNRLREAGVKGNYSRPENLHLTVKFLGELDHEDYTKACTALKKAALLQDPYVLTLDNLGKFDRGNRSIVWAGLKKSEPLLVTYKNYNRELGALLPGTEEKHYSPHITLVREAKTIIGFNDEPGDKPTFTAEGLSMMESTRVNGQLTYIRRYFEPFGKK